MARHDLPESARRLPELIELLKTQIAATGSQKNWATHHDVSPQHVCDVLAGNRGPGPKILAALGFEERVFYVPKS